MDTTEECWNGPFDQLDFRCHFLGWVEHLHAFDELHHDGTEQHSVL